MTLDQAKPGQWVKVTALPAGQVRAQIIRFGIVEGSFVLLGEVIPGGPVILEHGYQEIAIGRRLAQRIEVVPKNIKAKQRTRGRWTNAVS